MIYYLPQLLFDIMKEEALNKELDIVTLEKIIFNLENNIYKKKDKNKDNIFIALFFLNNAFAYFKNNNINNFLFSSKVASFSENKKNKPHIYTFMGPNDKSFLIVRSINDLSEQEISFLNIIRRTHNFVLIDDNTMEEYFFSGVLRI